MSDDTWQRDANYRLQQHLMRGVLKGRNYAPDSNYEQLKRGHASAHSVQISDIFAKWAAMWANDRRELAKLGASDESEPDAEWLVAMRSADAEVDRYLDANKLPRNA